MSSEANIMSFESSRSMGRAASLLIIVGTVISPILVVIGLLLHFTQSILFLMIPLSFLGFAGSILFLFSMRGFTKYYREPAIFRNALRGFLTSIIGGVVLIFIIFLSVFGFINSLIRVTPYSSSPPITSVFISLFVFIAIIWVCAFIIALIQSIFYKRAFEALAEKSGVSKFKEAGLLMLIGGALTIAFVGGIVFFIGWIFVAMGFFSIKPLGQTNILNSQQQFATQKKYCPYCGAEHSMDSIYCSHCGNKL